MTAWYDTSYSFIKLKYSKIEKYVIILRYKWGEKIEWQHFYRKKELLYGKVDMAEVQNIFNLK